jgi:glutamine synthetase
MRTPRTGTTKSAAERPPIATAVDTGDLSLEQQQVLQEKVRSCLAEDGIDSVRIVLVDLHGVPRAKVVGAERFERIMTAGHAWALPLLAADLWQSIPPEETELGSEIGYRNGVMIPDLRTFARLPWTRSTAHVMANVYSNEGQEMPSPRQVLGRVLRKAQAAGYEPVFGSELEFYVYRPEHGDRGFNDVFDRQSWFSVNALGLTQQFTDLVADSARSMGIPLWDLCSEHGAGQFEINLQPSSGLAAIDNVVGLKIAIKEVAQSIGMRATFLAKPTNLWETPTSGYHLHQMLRDTAGANTFYEPRDPDSLSSVGRHYIGGQLAHTIGMTGIAAPTVTAYKRYIPGTVAPVSVVWAVDNRSAPIRALPGGENTHIENRLGSSDANPYLLAAVNVAAGLDGIAKGTDPGTPGTGNLFLDKTFEHLPRTLIEGISAYEQDATLVQALGPDFTRIYSRVIRQDWKRYIEHVSDWEIREYREIL